MSLILRKDPIIEAVCEFQLDAPDWDWTVPGVVWKRIKEEFPEKREAPHINFSIEERPDGVHPSAQTVMNRMQFWSRDEKQLMQVGPQHFSVHQFKPYTGWPIFKAHIENMLEAYEEEAPFRAIKAMSLRYVNQIQLPQETGKFEHILKALPHIPNSEDEIWVNWFQQVEILKPELNAILGVRSGHFPQVPDSQEPPLPVTTNAVQFLMFDLMFAHVGVEPLNRSSVSEWLEMAHDHIETMFFNSIVDEHLQNFEPEVKEADAI